MKEVKSEHIGCVRGCVQDVSCAGPSYTSINVGTGTALNSRPYKKNSIGCTEESYKKLFVRQTRKYKKIRVLSFSNHVVFYCLCRVSYGIFWASNNSSAPNILP